MNFFALSSLATGPNILVPTGSLSLVMMTIELSSNLMYEPSARFIGFTVLTTTALATSPFFTLASGMDSLMLTTTTSPTPANILFDAPMTFMQDALLAPELSATVNMDLFYQNPVARLALAFFVVRHELRAPPDVLAVKRMLGKPLDRDNDGILHLVAYDRPLKTPFSRLSACHILLFLLGNYCLAPRYGAPRLPDPHRVFGLPEAFLHAEVEEVLPEFPLLAP